MPEQIPSQDEPRDFYVGYLPIPRRLLRFVRIAAPLTLWMLVLIGLVAARSQPNPGHARWDQGTPRTFTGTLVATPYPVLYTDARDDQPPSALLLVQPGKHGSAALAAPLDGQTVRATGFVLRRDGRLMLELEASPEALAPDPSARPAPPEVHPIGPITLRGEIVDAKCYLGAMKPGAGKTHKECATLCISGGIPPVLVTRDAAGAATYFLLMDPSGGPLNDAAYPFIADPIEVSGNLEDAGGILRLRISPDSIRRL
jgi:hypothetical protein